MYQDGFLCPLCGAAHGRDRGDAGRACTRSRARSRTRSRCAASSGRARAIAEGRFDAEIVPVTAPGGKGEARSRATSTRARTRPWPRWASCRPVFKDEGGHGDGGELLGHHRRRGGHAGACAARPRDALKVKPLARLLGVAAAGVDPQIMGIGVVPAVKRLLERPEAAPRRLRPRRGQRGLRGPGAGLRPRAALRPRAPERERRRDRARAPDRRHRRADRDHARCTR